MTAKRFTINNDMSLDSKVETYELSCIVDNSNKTFYFIVDSIANVESFVERLNELNEENTMLKGHIKELYKLVKFDVDNGIEVYPKVLLEYIVNILKIIGDVE